MKIRLLAPDGVRYVLYNDNDFVLHPDVHDACALLDAATVSERTYIEGVGTKYDNAASGKITYYVYDKWMHWEAT